MTRLVLWRHGQTMWNHDGRFQGQEDVDLNETGRAQAAAAAGRLATLGVDAIVASDLRRAVDTADELARLTALPVRTDARLRERYYGQWQGLTHQELAVRYPEEYARWRRFEPVDGCDIEDLDDLAKRVAAALQDAADLAPGGTVVVATHGGAAKYGMMTLLGWPRPVAATIAVLENCHWSLLRHDRVRGWQLRGHNLS
ncbi:MAG TPA: histidine phosphatase family protein [Micromonosporaceae bacterium]